MVASASQRGILLSQAAAVAVVATTLNARKGRQKLPSPLSSEKKSSSNKQNSLLGAKMQMPFSSASALGADAIGRATCAAIGFLPSLPVARAQGEAAARPSTSGLPATARSRASKFAHCVHVTRGTRASMEDRHFISPDSTFFAVYDGHGGPSVASYAASHAYDRIVAAMGSSPSHTDEEISTGLMEGFAAISEEVLKKKSMDYQGSTAVAVWRRATRCGLSTWETAGQ